MDDTMIDAPDPVIVYTRPPSRMWIYIAGAMTFLTIGIFVSTIIINYYAPLVGPSSVVQANAQPVHTDPPSGARDADQQIAEAGPAPTSMPETELTAGGAVNGAILPLSTAGRLQHTVSDLAPVTKQAVDPPPPQPASTSPASAQVSAPPASESPSIEPPASTEVQKWEKLMTAWLYQKQLRDQLYEWCQQPRYQAMGLCRK